MEEDIVVNVDFEGGNEQISNSIQVVPVNIAWEDFELMLKVYADQEHIQVYYTDEEGENIKVNSQEELEQAFKVAKLCNNTLHLKVQCTNCPPVEIVFEQPAPIVFEKQEAEKEEKVTADLKKQSVVMTTVKKSIKNSCPNEVKADTGNKCTVPIVMETGETNGPSCDWLVAMETGEKQMIKQETEKSGAIEAGAAVKEKDVQTEKATDNHKKLFFLKHKSSNMVLDVCNFSSLPDTSVILWTKKDYKMERAGNQLWYLDKKTGTIRSKFTNFCLDSSESGTKVSKYVEGKSSQMWVMGEGRISHKFNPNWVLGVKEIRPQQGVDVIACENKEKDERLRWGVEYRGPALTSVQKNKRNENYGFKNYKERKGDYYADLATNVGDLKRQDGLMGYDTTTKKAHLCDDDNGEMDDEWVPLLTRAAPKVPPRLGVQGKPPKWFLDYMEQFKKDMVEQSSEAIANRTVGQVMKGLDGAVIASVRGPTMPAAVNPHPPPVGSERQVYHHYGIICDGCENQIVGVRYKCGNCADYDLCDQCEAVEGIHQPDHVFLRIHRPVMTAGRKRDGTLVALLKFNLYQHEENMIKQLQRQQVQDEKKEEKLRQKAPQPQPRVHKDNVEKLKKKQEKLKKKGEKIEEKLKKKEKRRFHEEKELPQKKEKLELPQFKVPDRMDAELIADETIPDGTHVQPGTKLVKRWVMRNTGTSPWAAGTRLDMIWGNMTPVEEEVEVPYTAVGKKCSVSVVLVTPEEPGTYQSHWRMSYCGLRFGHRVWCSVVVDPKEVLEHSEPRSSPVDLDLNVLTLKDNEEIQQAEEIKVKDNDNDIEKDEESGEAQPTAPDAEHDEAQPEVTTQKKPDEVLIFESDRFLKLDSDELDLDRIEGSVKSLPKMSQTATPNNTPFESRDVTPPKSPVPEDLESERIWTLSNSSSVEVVSEIGSEPTHISEELVQERMANLGLKIDVDIDLESISSFDDEDSSGSDTDSDFFIVPIPDCFNPNLPASKVASTSLYVKKDEMQNRSADDLLTASQKLESQPLLAEAKEVEAQPLLTPSSSFAYTPLEPTNQFDDLFESAIQNEENEAIESLNQSDFNLANQNEERKELVAAAANDDQQTLTKTVEKDESEDEFVETVEPATAEGNTETQAQQGSADIASVIVSQAIDYATKASNTGIKICKDVFHTLQARNQYVPKQSEWTPKETNYTPPAQNWTPPPAPEEPAEEEVVGPPTLPPRRSDPTPMDQLIEMGFANRKQNEQLLKKYNNDVTKVIQDLLTEEDNNWHSTRH